MGMQKMNCSYYRSEPSEDWCLWSLPWKKENPVEPESSTCARKRMAALVLYQEKTTPYIKEKMK